MQELIEQLIVYARGIWHRRWIGLAAAWAVAIIGALIVFRLPDKYEASARVYVDTQNLLRPLMQGMAVNTNPTEQVSILSRTLLSRPNVEKIIRKSDLDTAAGVKADALIDDTLAALKIARVSTGENLYTIAFRYPDARKARDVVQAALSTFIEQSLGENRSGADSARRFLDEQIKEYEKKLQEAEARVQGFKLKYMGLLGTSGQTYLSQMGAINDQIRDTRLELRVAEQTRDGIRRQLEDQATGGSGPTPGPAPEATVDVASPEIDARIDAQKRQLDELLRRYTDQHPDVVGINRQLARLEEEKKRDIEARRRAAEANPTVAPSGDPIAQQLKVALNEADGKVTTLRARLAEYEARISQLRGSAESLPKIDAELASLNRDYDIQKRQYESLVARRETADISTKLEDAGVAEFRIIDPPRVTPNPVAPNRLLLLGGLLGVSLLAGIAVSFLVSQVRPTFHDGHMLRNVVHRPVLGIVTMLPSPVLRQKQMRAALLFTGGVGGLIAVNGAALLFTYLTTRGF
jgi:polysaccharide chain length determinant protein (PEP-CTERM system associated)